MQTHKQTLQQMMIAAEKRAASSLDRSKNLCQCPDCARRYKSQRASALALHLKFKKEAEALAFALGRLT